MISFLMVGTACAKVTVQMAVLRNGVVNSGVPTVLEQKKEHVRIFQDEKTYIEAELFSENNDTILIVCTVATKCETGAFVVRGMPRMTISIKDGMGMTSMNGNGRDENFMMIMAAAKVN